MPEIFIVTPVAVGETSVPDGLAINAPDREPLKRGLRKAGLTVIATNSTFNPRIPRSEDLNARISGPAPDSKTLANAVFPTCRSWSHFVAAGRREHRSRPSV